MARSRSAPPRCVVAVVVAVASALIVSLTQGLSTSPASASQDAPTRVITEAEHAVEALAAAKRQGSRVEITSERTPFSSTYGLPSGKREVELTAPFRIQREGQWYSFDPTLIPTRGDVQLPVVEVGRGLPRIDQRPLGLPGGDRRSSRVILDLKQNQTIGDRLADLLRSEERARKRAGSRFGEEPVLSPRVSMVPIRIARGGTSSADAADGEEATPLGEMETTRGASIAVFWPEDLPEADVEGREASYDLSGPRELRVTAAARGLEVHVVLQERPNLANGAPVYRFPIEVDGVRLARTEAGGYAARNADGKTVFEIAPTMAWDSSPPNPETPEEPNSVPVESELVAEESGQTVLEVRPSAAWLATAQCPCVIDPNFTLNAGSIWDTLVREANVNTNYASSNTIHTGTKDATTLRQRAFLDFDTGLVANKQISSATLQLRNTNSNTCTATGVSVYPISGSWTAASTTWTAKPGYYTTSTYRAQRSFAHGFSTSCAAAYETFNVTATVAAWSAGTIVPNGFAVVADNETATTHFKAFCSFEVSPTTGCNQAAWTPKLTVIYNTRPGYVNDSGIQPATSGEGCVDLGTAWVNTTVPIITGSPRDSDRDQVRLDIEVWPISGVAATVTGSSGFLPSGALNTWQVPSGKLLDGRDYKWRAKGNDGADASLIWANWCNFSVDITQPNAPSITSTDYPSGQWSGAANTTGTFTITPGTDPAPSGGTASGVAGVMYSLDDPTPTEAKELNGSGGIDPISLTPTADGKHTLYVSTIDKAGNLSTPAAHEFFVGNGALTSPEAGDRTARRFALSAQAEDATAVTFQWRRGETDNWTDVPNGVAVPIVSGVTGPLDWDAAGTVGADGKVDLRVLLIGGSANGQGSFPISVTIDRLASDAATTSVGPGTLNLLTGDYTLSATDVSYWGVSITRTARSRDPQSGAHVTGLVAPFGPQWAAGGVSEFAGTDFASLTQTSDESIELVRTDATKVQFTLTFDEDNGEPIWEPEVGAEDLTLVGEAGTFTLTGIDGTVVKFIPSGTAGLSTVRSATPPGNGNVTRYYYGSDGAGKLRLERIIAPNASITDLATCDVAGAPPVGCRRLDLVYATATTASSSTLGDVAGRVASVNLRVTVPGTSTVTNTPVTAYAYDDLGRLREAWDPRISPALKTAYTYDGAGRVASQTPPGELGWTFAYGTIGSDPNAGWLYSVSRGLLEDDPNTSGTQTEGVWNVVYDVPLNTSGTASLNGPHAMQPGDVAAWGQVRAPVDASAVLPPDAGFSGSHSGGRSAGGWTRATISYLDFEGRRVNQAVPGGGISATAYDEFGNVVRELSINNRARALRATSDDELIALGLAELTTAQRADLLAELWIYNQAITDNGREVPAGQRLLETYGPVHRVVLPDVGATPGAPALAREHTVNVYDQGRPTDGSAKVADQVTQTKTGARVIGADSDVDVRTTNTEYDWAQGLPTRGTRENGTIDLTTVMEYDGKARPIRTDMPSATGATPSPRTNGADSTFTRYYADGAASPCDSKVLDGLVCQSGPAGAISGGGSNPAERITTTMTYTELGQVDVVSEVANGVTRTTDMNYDAAGRVTLVTVTASGGAGLGNAVPTVATTYSTTTGRMLTSVDASVTPNPPTITRSYDALGRITSYIDADGGKTETTYTWLDQVATTKQYSSTVTPTVPHVTTYGYSADRQLLASLVDPLAGTFTAVHDPAGQVVTQVMPGGITMAQTENPTGAWLTRTYTGNGTPYSGVLLSEEVLENVHGQWRTRARGDRATGDLNQATGTTQRYDYDLIGRLTQVLDTTGTAAGSTCVRRDYGFGGNAGLNTNRTSYSEATSSAGKDSAAVCPTSPGSSTASTYDTADRITNAGYVYDSHGRTTAAALPAGTAAIEYYRNDMVRRQTIGNTRQTWWLDPGMRLRSWTTEINTGAWNQTGAKINHFSSDAGGADSPTWIAESPSAVTRYVSGIAGDLAAYTDGATANAFWLQLTTLHGDVGQSLHYASATASDSALVYDNTEYGARKPGTNGSADGRYAWLGGRQRSAETVGGSLVLMGVRLFNPASGRFLTTDPVAGGSANAYEYCIADPVNCFDLDGRDWKTWIKWGKWGLDVVAFGTSVVALTGCAAICATFLISYTTYKALDSWRKDRKGQALFEIVTVGSMGMGKYLKYLKKMKRKEFRGDAAAWRKYAERYRNWYTADRAIFGASGLIVSYTGLYNDLPADNWQM